MTGAELYDQGYAVPSYDINNNTQIWRFRDQTITLPLWAVPMVQLKDCAFKVAKWSDVQAAQ